MSIKMKEFQFQTSKMTYERIEEIKKKFKVNALSTVARWAIAEGMEIIFFVGVKDLKGHWSTEELLKRDDGGHRYYIQSNEALAKTLDRIMINSGWLKNRAELLMLLCYIGAEKLYFDDSPKLSPAEISNIYNREWTFKDGVGL